MAHGFQQLIRHIRDTHKDIRGSASYEWGALSTEARQAIRRDIGHSLNGLDKEDEKALADLNHPPRLGNWNVSISHTANLGGWVALPKPTLIGLDIELLSRVSPKVLARVTDPLEREAAPEPNALWSAKEAVFKSLPPNLQPKAFSSVRVDNWNRLEPGLFTFQGEQDGRGWVCLDARYSIAVYGVSIKETL